MKFQSSLLLRNVTFIGNIGKKGAASITAIDS